MSLTIINCFRVYVLLLFRYIKVKDQELLPLQTSVGILTDHRRREQPITGLAERAEGVGANLE